jgi:nicotinate-nucleotide adenylyltransferase
MTGDRRLGVLGGTFDPIHYGHLRAGETAQSTLALDEIRVVPAHDPPHRALDPRASAFHRFALIALAIDGRPNWRLSDAEVTRSGPSYTAHTLRSLHQEGWRRSQIFFILGSDAFAEIATWFEFPAVLDEANFVVIARPGTGLDAAIARTPALVSRVQTVQQPHKQASSDRIRTGIFPIETQTPDISSSDIRGRLAAKLPTDDLMPAPVARYIQNHHLYGSVAAVGDLHGETGRTHR